MRAVDAGDWWMVPEIKGFFTNVHYGRTFKINIAFQP
jgi:hypothetical protein